MSNRMIACLSFLIFLLTGFSHSEAAWMLEGQVLHLPYQESTIYLSQLSLKLEPHKDMELIASLPFQYSRIPGFRQVEFLSPRLSLVYTPSFDPVHSGILKIDYDLKAQNLRLQGGLSLVHDPLAMNLVISYYERDISLDGSVVFAVNERWALGTHLHYAKNSVLTYEIYHTSRNGKHRQVRYSHSLDGSMQSLGFKLTL